MPVLATDQGSLDDSKISCAQYVASFSRNISKCDVFTVIRVVCSGSDSLSVISLSICIDGYDFGQGIE